MNKDSKKKDLNMIFYQPMTDITINKLKPFKIAWLFPENELEKNPSDRLRRYQISRFINNNVIDKNKSINIFGYARVPDLKKRLDDVDILVLLNIGQIDLDLCRMFRERGKTVIFDHCERIFGLACEDLIMQEVSAITCCSRALANTTEMYLKNRGIDQKIFVIRDPIDDDIFLRKEYFEKEENIALLMGMGGNIIYTLPILEPICSAAGYKIRIISEPGLDSKNHEYRIWTLDTWIKDACSCSVALCYHDPYRYPDKGNVKVTMAMGLGLPVIASPVEAYREAIINGVNGFITDDWVSCLELLKDYSLRYMMGFKAMHTAKALYSTEKIGLDYISMIQELQK